MRIEILLFLVASVWVAHIYSDGKYWKQLLTYKKYYQMGGVIIGFFVLCWLFKKNPRATQEMIFSTNEYMKFLPVDKNVKSLAETFFHPRTESFSQPQPPSTTTVKKGGGGSPTASASNKRSVSESKKKYVASKQGWKCRQCQELLPATFEVDHIQRLQYGGSNDIGNLQALCPNCHRSKTMLEVMEGGGV
jgi:5-methylcytosine-specific restriction endonuclease McrA